jgi:hypothetical protein
VVDEAHRLVENAAVSVDERYVYRVERADDRPGHVRISLVRQRERNDVRHLRHHLEVLERTVLFSRSFRPMFDLAAMEGYAAHLSLLARHAEEGRLGCFVQTRSESGNVDVCLYERWFDGGEIHTDELARRAFDASDESALVASAEFLADLRGWAERRNEQREAAYLQEREDDDARMRIASDQQAAGEELNEILAAHTREI